MSPKPSTANSRRFFYTLYSIRSRVEHKVYVKRRRTGIRGLGNG